MPPLHAPTIDELLADGLIQAVMRADQVDPHALRTLLGGVADRVAARRDGAPQPAGPSFAPPHLEWRPHSGRADAPARARPAAIAEACGPALCC
jgi:hypothetical protein